LRSCWDALYLDTDVMVQCVTFGWWRNYRSWWTVLLGVVKWQGVGVCLLGTSV